MRVFHLKGETEGSGIAEYVSGTAAEAGGLRKIYEGYCA